MENGVVRKDVLKSSGGGLFRVRIRLRFKAQFAQGPADHGRHAIDQQEDTAPVSQIPPDQLARLGGLQIIALDDQHFRILVGRDLFGQSGGLEESRGPMPSHDLWREGQAQGRVRGNVTVARSVPRSDAELAAFRQVVSSRLAKGVGRARKGRDKTDSNSTGLLKMTWLLTRNSMLALRAGPEWLSLMVKLTSDLSPRKIRCARGSERDRFAASGEVIAGSATSTFCRKGGVFRFSLHWFSWLSLQKITRFRLPNELASNVLAWRNAARYEPRWKEGRSS